MKRLIIPLIAIVLALLVASPALGVNALPTPPAPTSSPVLNTPTPTRTPTPRPTLAIPTVIPTPTSVPTSVVQLNPCAFRVVEGGELQLQGDYILPPLPVEVEAVFEGLQTVLAQLEEACKTTRLVFETTPKELEVAANLVLMADEIIQGKVDGPFDSLQLGLVLTNQAIELEQKVILKHKTGAEVLAAYAEAIRELSEAIERLRNAVTG